MCTLIPLEGFSYVHPLSAMSSQSVSLLANLLAKHLKTDTNNLIRTLIHDRA